MRDSDRLIFQRNNTEYSVVPKEIYKKVSVIVRPLLMSLVLSATKATQSMTHQYWFAATDLHDTNTLLDTKVKHDQMNLHTVKSWVKCLHVEPFGDMTNRVWTQDYAGRFILMMCLKSKVFLNCTPDIMLHYIWSTYSALLCLGLNPLPADRASPQT